ncbi:MAG TPA: BON domain-containing protein [Steroidobacteraceae bacterium]
MSKLSAFVRSQSRTLPLLLAATLACGSIAFADTDGMGKSSSDAAIKSQVEAALHGDKALLARHINVSVKEGVVRLGGFVGREEDIKLAKNDASGVAGVKNVKNEMTLKRGSSDSSTSE